MADQILPRGTRNLKGREYERLTVLEYVGSAGGSGAVWLCECKCGTLVEVPARLLKKRSKKSCGCLNTDTRRRMCRERNTTHGKSNTPEYRCWLHMNERCNNSNSPDYPDYGGRGITVCERWRGPHGFENFLADLGPRPSLTHSVGRKENDGPYSPENTFWATPQEQGRNKRSNYLITWMGRAQCLVAWAKELKIHPQTLRDRLEVSGWSVEKAMTTPVRQRRILPCRAHRSGD